MELGIREWLIVGGVILVLAVLVDGFRRMRSERKSGIKMSLGLGGGFPDTDEFGPELPNGGARIVNRTDPVLSDDIDFPGNGVAGPADNFKADEALASIRAEQSSAAPGAVAVAPASDPDPMPEFVGNQELLVMHVKSNDENGFNGSDLLQILLACDLRYGDRDILHRHEQADGHGYLQFSVANMVEPGTFSLEDINSFRTPGVTFFLALPGPEDPLQAFDCMIETANCLVKNLNATLLDEDHSSANPQVINHYRDRVSSFVQRQQAELA